MNLIRGAGDFFRLIWNRTRLDEAGIKKYQYQQIKRLFNYSIENSPFYRDYYHGKHLENMEDFFSLPTINKQVMMNNFTELNTCGLNKQKVLDFAVEKEKNKDYEGYYLDKYVVGLSSGTSGSKGIYITPRDLTQRLPFVFLARSGLRLVHLPYRILFLLRVFSQGFRDINSSVVKLDYMSTMTDPELIIRAVNEKHINIIMAPPSLLRLLIPYRENIRTKLKHIVCYAEVLEREEKDRLSEIFDVPVIEIYQASEGQIASACGHGNLHINEDLVFIEIYDEDGFPVNQPGVAGTRMLLTNLVNYAQPLIRYEMNDMIVLGDKCPCGSKFRVVDRIIGRNDDVLVFMTADGKSKQVFPDLFSRWIITASDHIREFKVVQDEADAVTVYIDFLESPNGRSSGRSPNEQMEHAKTRNDEERGTWIETIYVNLTKELAEFGLHPVINIVEKKIELPKDRSKYKRFECFKCEERVEQKP